MQILEQFMAKENISENNIWGNFTHSGEIAFRKKNVLDETIKSNHYSDIARGYINFDNYRDLAASRYPQGITVKVITARFEWIETVESVESVSKRLFEQICKEQQEQVQNEKEKMVGKIFSGEIKSREDESIPYYLKSGLQRVLQFKNTMETEYGEQVCEETALELTQQLIEKKEELDSLLELDCIDEKEIATCLLEEAEISMEMAALRRVKEKVNDTTYHALLRAQEECQPLLLFLFEKWKTSTLSAEKEWGKEIKKALSVLEEECCKNLSYGDKKLLFSFVNGYFKQQIDLFLQCNEQKGKKRVQRWEALTHTLELLLSSEEKATIEKDQQELATKLNQLFQRFLEVLPSIMTDTPSFKKKIEILKLPYTASWMQTMHKTSLFTSSNPTLHNRLRHQVEQFHDIRSQLPTQEMKDFYQNQLKAGKMHLERIATIEKNTVWKNAMKKFAIHSFNEVQTLQENAIFFQQLLSREEERSFVAQLTNTTTTLLNRFAQVEEEVKRVLEKEVIALYAELKTRQQQWRHHQPTEVHPVLLYSWRPRYELNMIDQKIGRCLEYDQIAPDYQEEIKIMKKEFDEQVSSAVQIIGEEFERNIELFMNELKQLKQRLLEAEEEQEKEALKEKVVALAPAVYCMRQYASEKITLRNELREDWIALCIASKQPYNIITEQGLQEVRAMEEKIDYYTEEINMAPEAIETSLLYLYRFMCYHNVSFSLPAFQIEDLLKYIKHLSNHPTVYPNFCNFIVRPLTEMQEYDLANKLIDTALQIPDIEKELLYTLYDQKGVNAFSRGYFQEALSSFTLVATENPNAASLNLPTLYFKMEWYEKAAEEYFRIVESTLLTKKRGFGDELDKEIDEALDLVFYYSKELYTRV